MARKKKKKKSLFPPKYFIGALISGIKGAKQSKADIAKAEGERQANLAKEEAERANRQKLTMSPEIEKLKEGLGGTEIQRRQESAERTRAAAMGAATRGGTRVDPFAAARAGQAQEAALSSEQSTAKRKGLEAGVTERGKLRTTQEAREQADLVRAAQQSDYSREDVMAGQANLAGYQQQQYGAIDAGIGTVASMASDKKLKKNIKKVGKTEEGVPVSNFEYKKDKDAPKGPGRYRGVIAQDLMDTRHEDAIKKIDKNTLGVNYSKLDIKLGKIKGDRLKDKIKKGKDKRGYINGGEPEVTPGKFSHRENPIDLVQKNGEEGEEKIGEMTGGEAIVPPKNVKQIRSMIKNEDGEALVNLMDNLLDKWDREADENVESKEVFDKTKKAKRGSMVRIKGARHQGVRKPRLPLGKDKFKSRRSSIFN